MPWTRYQAEQLWAGEDEVDDLRNEEEEQGLAEMAEYANDSKCHATEIAESISDECVGRVPVSIIVSHCLPTQLSGSCSPVMPE